MNQLQSGMINPQVGGTIITKHFVKGTYQVPKRMEESSPKQYGSMAYGLRESPTPQNLGAHPRASHARWVPKNDWRTSWNSLGDQPWRSLAAGGFDVDGPQVVFWALGLMVYNWVYTNQTYAKIACIFKKLLDMGVLSLGWVFFAHL